jgi:hypothetical protein
MSGWRAIHLHAHDEQDLDRLVEAAAAAVRRHARDPTDWFFIRYTESGLHVRVRLGDGARGSFDAIASELGETCRALAQARPDAPAHPMAHPGAEGLLQAPGTAVETEYEPETLRYGGVRGLEINERLFRTSSAIAAAVTARTALLSRPRIAQAADLTLATLATLTGAEDPIAFLKDYAAGWRRAWTIAGRASAAPSPDTGLRARYAAHLEAAAGRGAAGNTPAAIWTAALVAARADFDEAHGAGGLVSPMTGRATSGDGERAQALASFAHSRATEQLTADVSACQRAVSAAPQETD